MGSSPSSPEPRRGRRDWASLDAGPAGLIAERVLSNDVVDLVRFRAVCRPWRACSAHLRAQGVLDRRFHPRRWIMLPDTFNDVHHRRCFINVFTGERIYPSAPPKPDSCHLLGNTSEGLVLLSRKDADLIQLLNPMTGQVTDLPPASKLLEDPYERPEHLTLRGAGLADDSTIAIHLKCFSLAVAKPGDKRWTYLRSRHRITSVLPLAGRIYCATKKNISVVQTMENQRPQLVEAADHNLDMSTAGAYFGGEPYIGRNKIFLVDNDGELILCHRRCWEPGSTHGSCCLYRVNFDTRNIQPLARLNERALFISRRRSLLVASMVSPSISADTVYVCWPKVAAIDLSGGCAKPKFKKGDDAAYYLSCYI
ncbi:hypothetical protein EJB05_11668, partial [Eragrostis curvula]